MDLTGLPAPLARTRERLLAAARSGDLAKLADLVRTNETVFTFSDDKDPIAFWKASYPNSEGIEVLSILIGVLETGFVRVDEGTPQEIYVWPYFVRMPLKSLSPPHRSSCSASLPAPTTRICGFRRLCVLPCRDRTGRHLAFFRRRGGGGD